MQELNQNKQEKLDTVMLACYVISLFSLPLFESPKTIFLILSFLLLLITLAKEKHIKFLISHRIGIGFLTLATVATASAISSDYVSHSLHGAAGYWRMYIYFILTLYLSRNKNFAKLLNIIFPVSIIISSIAGMIDLQTTEFLELPSVGHPNQSGAYISLSILLMIYLYKASDSPKIRIFMVFSLIISLISLMLTASRASILGLTIASVIWFLTMTKRELTVLLTTSTITLMLLYIAGGFKFLKMKGLSDTITHGRIYLWKDAVNMFKKNVLLGVGPKNFEFFSSMNHAHSLFLGILSQMGILGMTALIYLLYGIAKSISELRNYKYELSLLAGATVFIMVDGIFNTTLFVEHGDLFSVICAIAISKKYC